VAPNGKLIAAVGDSSGSGVTVRRYARSGAPDTSFAGDGRTRFSFGGPGIVFGAAANASGQVYVVGAAPDRPTQAKLAIARLRDDGSLDTSFAGGMVRFPTIVAMNASFSGAIVQPTAAGGVAVFIHYVDPAGTERSVMVRLRRYGALDSSLSGDGVHPMPTYPWSVAISPSGRFAYFDGSLHRRLASGRPDQEFSDDGKVLVPRCAPSMGFGERDTAVAFDPDGRLIVACFRKSNYETVVRRYRTDGELDPSFSADGVVRGFGVWVAVDPIGRLLVGRRLNGVHGIRLVRLRRNGLVDSTFGVSGVAERPDADAPDIHAVSDRLYLAWDGWTLALTN
jgi:uncharacterized delta-60 repeat protein